MAPVPGLQHVARVTQASPKSYTSAQGYLVVEPGDEVKVLYLGHGDSKGWIYASLARKDGPFEGWLPISTVLEKPLAPISTGDDSDEAPRWDAARWQ
mmetsp:Transcript_15513/g.35483  ORF Transcript_15513/g.35483 Transcript_15513/m.35483 type:complete len:97 (-) Transcript_15513:1134-1424(-)